ncbi:hypothetical protein LLE49_09860 [Alicyclobacillus tolerans]|uniref:hypothetical protein n=1 Tax=Alicyclobacillus tolerans TaxID=90970 RepID=UPI001F15AC67|nr:hypothetical protein [Alicyclobacillus tolerans]MCF8565020.1 hypothetical protein [Alicyclobacillus tolerans]
MSMPEVHASNPDRLYDILDAMSVGLTREEVAEIYGHKDKATIDQFMRRHGYVWDKTRQNYVQKDVSGMHRGRISSSRAVDVMAQFRKPGADPKEIAKRLRFASHHEMAKYMRARGYRWDPDLGNYTAVSAEVEDEDIEATAEPDSSSSGPAASAPTKTPALPSIDWGKFVPLLLRLQKNEDKLMQLLSQTLVESAEIPRYAIPGVFTVKSIHMNVSLDQLVKEFSREKNISQREIFEVALVQFFKKYGYEREVEALLGQSGKV